MAFCELHYFSDSLQKAISADIILPEKKEGPFYALYLLHGLSDDHTIWQRRTSIERYVQDLPLIVVMPDGGRGFYTDALEGMAWESSIVKDLVNYVDTMLPTIASREGRCVEGLSMGGYGAIKFALKHPDMFSSAVGHSGAVAWGHKPLIGNEPYTKEFRHIAGEHPEGGENDLFALAKSCSKDLIPAIRFDCGTEDFLIEDNRVFHAYLEEIKFPHEYEEFPGTHEWGYWDVHVREGLEFHRRNIGF